MSETLNQLKAEKKRRLINLTVAVFAGQSDNGEPKVSEADVCAMLLRVENRKRLRVLEQEIFSAWVGAICAFAGPADGFERPEGFELPDVAYCYAKTFDAINNNDEDPSLKGGKRIYEQLLDGEFPDYWRGKLDDAGVSMSESALVFAESMEVEHKPSSAGKDKDEQKDDTFFWTCAQCKGHAFYDDPIDGGKYCSGCNYELTGLEIQKINEAVARADGLAPETHEKQRNVSKSSQEGPTPSGGTSEPSEAAEEPSEASAPEPKLTVVEPEPVPEPEPVWTSSDGTVTPVSEMGQMHLVNAYRQLRGRLEKGISEPGDVELYDAMWNRIVDLDLQKAASETRMMISPAKLSMAIRCGEQYKFRYEDGLKIPPSGAMIVGSAVGVSAERNLRWKRSEGTTKSVEEVLDIAADEFSRRWDNSDVQLDDDEASKGVKKVRGGYLDATVKAARVHAERFAPTIDVVDVESEFSISPGHRDWTLYGYKDVKTPTGVRELKTGGRLKSQKDADSDLQLTAYALDERVSHGNKEADLVMDTINRKNGKFAMRETKRTDENLKSFLSMADLLVEAIKRGTLPPARFKPGWWPCSEKYCGYWHRCRFGARFGRKVD